MLKFLFGRRSTPEEPLVLETQRQVFTRLIAELNTALDSLPEKPKVTFDPASGHIDFDLPEQFPDEAPALPAPEPEEVSAAPEPTLEETHAEDHPEPEVKEPDKSAA